MRVALLTTFAAGRKEPLAAMLDRVHQAFLDAGLGEPAIQFNFGDSPIAGGVSSVDRVLKRHSELARFVTEAPPMPGFQGSSRRISNGPMSPGAGESIPYSTLQEIAAGVPRSFPFHSVVLLLQSPVLGELGGVTRFAEMLPGVLISDSWWVNGRNRSLSACTVVEGDPAGKKLPPLPGAVASVFAACGKARRTVQAPLADAPVTTPVPGVRLPTGIPIASANPEAARAVYPIVQDYRARMMDIVVRAALPHDLPDSVEAYQASLGATSGPRKPALDQAFKPMGYTCRGNSGTFTLRRRTAANLTAELHLDVGTWSSKVLAMFKIYGLGFKATLMLPVSANATVAAQYPIGDAESWQKIVDNLAALVRELERTFLPEIEAAAGPSPEWYQPES